MPYVNVRITRDGVTRDQKAQVIADRHPQPHAEVM